MYCNGCISLFMFGLCSCLTSTCNFNCKDSQEKRSYLSIDKLLKTIRIQSAKLKSKIDLEKKTIDNPSNFNTNLNKQQLFFFFVYLAIDWFNILDLILLFSILVLLPTKFNSRQIDRCDWLKRTFDKLNVCLILIFTNKINSNWRAFAFRLPLDVCVFATFCIDGQYLTHCFLFAARRNSFHYFERKKKRAYIKRIKLKHNNKHSEKDKDKDTISLSKSCKSLQKQKLKELFFDQKPQTHCSARHKQILV